MISDSIFIQKYKDLMDNNIYSIILHNDFCTMLEIYYDGIINRITIEERFDKIITWLYKNKLAPKNHLNYPAIRRCFVEIYRLLDFAIKRYGYTGLLNLKNTNQIKSLDKITERKVIDLAIKYNLQIDGTIKHEIDAKREEIKQNSQNEQIQPQDEQINQQNEPIIDTITDETLIEKIDNELKQLYSQMDIIAKQFDESHEYSYEDKVFRNFCDLYIKVCDLEAQKTRLINNKQNITKGRCI